LVGVRAEADDAVRGRSVLLSTLSHDLRNPLSVVLVSLRMLSRAIPPENPARKHVDALGRASEEIGAILEDMSDVARIDEARLALSLTEISLADVCAAAAAASQRGAEARNVSILCSHGDLPPILGDRGKLQRVVSNLVSNAVRVTPRGGTVTVRTERDGDDGLRLSITDGGPGIPADVLPLLFELPSPASAGKPRPPGTGLPLHAGRGVAEAHGGQLWVETEPGHGSTFYMTLKLEP
jgi:signal transduction histidine kinase